MNRSQRVKKIFDRSAQLIPTNRWYKKQLVQYLLQPIKQDIQHDITTKQLFTRTAQAQAVLLSKTNGVFAGAQELRWICQQLKLTLKDSLADGSKLQPKQVIATISGNARTLLAAERTILNILQRMSGIATVTNQVIQQIKTSSVKVCATRKTLLGGLDKRAVSVGGGYTHRLGLHDGVMVKDNHLALLHSLGDLRATYYSKKTSREIEVSSLYEYKHFLNLNLDYDAIMLDNFSPKKMKLAMQWAKQQGFYQRYLFEASGGITSETIKIFAKTGVDVLSLGYLTHSVSALDLSLEITTHGTAFKK